MATREQNENRYRRWKDLPDGGREYWRDLPGKTRGFARYVKIVDQHERTLRITQLIYDDTGKLIQVHEKFPEDTGHQDINP